MTSNTADRAVANYSSNTHKIHARIYENRDSCHESGNTNPSRKRAGVRTRSASRSTHQCLLYPGVRHNANTTTSNSKPEIGPRTPRNILCKYVSFAIRTSRIGDADPAHAMVPLKHLDCRLLELSSTFDLLGAGSVCQCCLWTFSAVYWCRPSI